MASSSNPFKRPGLLMGLLVALVAAVASSRPFWPGELLRHPWMTFVRDDFFYYLEIARRIAAGDGSTFNGIVRTNGYHPLWMVLLSVLVRFSVAPKVILGFVAVTAVLSTVAMYGFSCRILECCGLRGWMAALTAAYVALCALPICFYGMEVTLAMPLALALAWHVLRWPEAAGTRWWLLAGTLTSLLVLARVDALLLAVLLAAALFSVASPRQVFRWPHFAALLMGCAPLMGYLLWNWISFGLWLPVSGIAKQLRHGWTPSINGWASVFDGPRSAWLNLLMIAIGLVLLMVRWRRSDPRIRTVLLALLIYPLLFVLLFSVRSDWEMWPWYAWIWRPATCAALAVLLGAGYREWIPQRISIAVLSLLVAMRLFTSTWHPGQDDYYAAATEVQAFARTHPGVYAMGDRAGMIAWLLPAPLIQTEGLIMDREFLEHIRRQDALASVLRRYRVRYYMADDWAYASLMHNGCFDAEEPAEAGPESPRMRSRFCQTPVFSATHEDVTTLIYDLSTMRDRKDER